MPPAIPRIGLGTWAYEDDDECARNVRLALELGYRHVDTAQGYGNESAVGRGIERAAVPREEVFVATKVSTGNLAYDDVIESTRRSREKLGIDTIDLLYVHWPLRTYEPATTLAAFNELHEDDLIRHVGLSNFEPEQLDAAMEHLDVPITAHQVEMHPFCQQGELLQHAREDDHWLVAYSPLARGEVLDHPVVTAVADEAGRHPAAVALAWLLAKDHVAAIPKATGRDHLSSNLAAGEIDLTDDQLARLDAIEETERVVDPANAPWNA